MEPFSIMLFFLNSFVFAQLEGELLWPERGVKEETLLLHTVEFLCFDLEFYYIHIFVKFVMFPRILVGVLFGPLGMLIDYNYTVNIV